MAREEDSIKDLEAGEVVDLLDTQTFFELLGMPYPTDQGGVLERLVSERLVDGGPGRYSVRRMGALLLAKKLADFPDLARKAPRVVVYDGDVPPETVQTIIRQA